MENSKQIFMTGATSGFGRLACLQLLKSGHNVVVGYRDEEKAKRLQKSLDDALTVYKGKLTLVYCDLSDLKSIKSACDSVQEQFELIDELILNAATWNFKFTESKDYIEEIFQVNYLANVLIINELQSLVEKSKKGKIIITASALHQGKINFADLELRKRFSGYNSYRQSKLAVLLLTRWLSHRIEGRHIGIYCFHPGVIQTELGRHANKLFRFFFRLIGSKKSKGANALLHLSNAEKLNLVQGGYYANHHVKKTTKASYDMKAAEELVECAFKYFKDLNVKNNLY